MHYNGHYKGFKLLKVGTDIFLPSQFYLEWCDDQLTPILRLYTSILGEKSCKMYSSLTVLKMSLDKRKSKIYMSEQRYSERIRPSDS